MLRNTNEDNFKMTAQAVQHFLQETRIELLKLIEDPSKLVEFVRDDDNWELKRDGHLLYTGDRPNEQR